MTTSIATPPKLQFFDANGVPLSGGKLYSYAAGTTTPLATYTSSSGGTANTNPVILDSRGEANVWLNPVTYKLKLTSAADVEIWTVDNLNGPDQATLSSIFSSLSASSGSSLIGYTQGSTGSVSTTVQTKLRETISLSDFGFVGDGVTDNTAAMNNLNALILSNEKSGYRIICNAGTYLSSVALRLVGYNVTLVGHGYCRFIGTGTDRTVYLGDAAAKSNATTVVITTNLLANANSCTVASTSGLVVGEYLYLMAYESVNSNRGSTPANQLPANWIPQHKQLFTIASINTSTNVVTFKEHAEYDFPGYGDIDPRTGVATLWYNAGRFHDPSLSSYQPLFDSTIENIKFSNQVGSSATYMMSGSAGSNIKVIGCEFSAASACGFIGNGDQLLFTNCRFSGYGGFSTANATKSVEFHQCRFEQGDGSTQYISLYVEESTERAKISNCVFVNGKVSFTASGDTTYAKNYVLCDSIIKYSGTTPPLVISGMQQPTTGAGQILIDNVTILSAGANSNRGNKCLVDIYSSKWVCFNNCKFVGADADAYMIDFNASDSTYLQVNKNCNRDSGISMVGPGNPLQTTTTFINIDDLECSLPVDSVGAVINGRKYISMPYDKSTLKVIWVFDQMFVNTYTLFTFSRTNGQHLVSVSAYRSGSGRSISYNNVTYRNFNTAPVSNNIVSYFQNASFAYSTTTTTNIIGTFTNSQATSGEQTVIEMEYAGPLLTPATSLSGIY